MGWGPRQEGICEKNETVVPVLDSRRARDEPTAPTPEADLRVRTTAQPPAGHRFLGLSSTHVLESLRLTTGFNGGWAGP